MFPSQAHKQGYVTNLEHTESVLDKMCIATDVNVQTTPLAVEKEVKMLKNNVVYMVKKLILEMVKNF